MTDLGSLGGGYTMANAINNRGQVVGISATSAGETHGFLWQQGVMTDLGVGNAEDINDRGQIVGTGEFGEPEPAHAYLLQQGRLTNLETRPLAFSQAFAVNERGWAVGYGWTVREPSASPPPPGTNALPMDAYLWRAGTMTRLGAIGLGSCVAAEINDSGQVIGQCDGPGGLGHGFLWQRGAITDLTQRGIPLDATVNDINNSGQIVGTVKNKPGIVGTHPTLFTPIAPKGRHPAARPAAPSSKKPSMGGGEATKPGRVVQSPTPDSSQRSRHPSTRPATSPGRQTRPCPSRPER